MDATRFSRLLKQIDDLGVDELARLRGKVAARESQVEGLVVLRDQERKVDECPHCASHRIVRYGWSDGRQRFQCKDCKRTFNALTGTGLARLRQSEKHIKNARCMAARLTLHETAAALDVARTTAFRWRHRFLAHLAKANPSALSGVVETDETFFLESFKGQKKGLPRTAKKRGRPASRPGLSNEQIPVLVAWERATRATLTQRLQSRQAKDIGEVLIPRLSKDVMLMTDGAKAYKWLARAHGIAITSVPPHPKHRTSGIYHLNNVNGYDHRLKTWLGRFAGIATKYLPDYLGWHRWHDANAESRNGRRFLEAALGRG